MGWLVRSLVTSVSVSWGERDSSVSEVRVVCTEVYGAENCLLMDDDFFKESPYLDHFWRAISFIPQQIIFM